MFPNDWEMDLSWVFVYGSNEAGIHGAGAAKTAMLKYGAKWGKGVGLSGKSYAIPTKNRNIKTLPLSSVKKYVDDFIAFAMCNPKMTFAVTKIGCGLAGFSEKEIAPLFINSPSNCILPLGWR